MRPSSAKATRGVSKARKPVCSSASNPKSNKYRSQYNSLAVIAKGGPSKKAQNQKSLQKRAKDATERKKLLDGLEKMDVIGRDDDAESMLSAGSRLTTASFASVWSNCTNASLNEFFQNWNPNLETHKDALAVVAGLSQLMTDRGTDQTDLEFVKTLFQIISSDKTPPHILTGALLAMTFVFRKLSDEQLNENFDMFYKPLKDLMEQQHTAKKKTMTKCLVRCIARLTKAHPSGKKAIDTSLRKRVNLAIRQLKVQDKIHL